MVSLVDFQPESFSAGVVVTTFILGLIFLISKLLPNETQ